MNLGHLDFDIVSDFDIRISDFAGIGIFTTVEESLQINLFMQNKANFRKSQMNVSVFIQKAYENKTLSGSGKNKANQSQLKPIQSQSKPIFRMLKMNITSFITKDYENMSNWAICENKAKTNPIKANFTILLTPKRVKQRAKKRRLKISCLTAQTFLCSLSGF